MSGFSHLCVLRSSVCFMCRIHTLSFDGADFTGVSPALTWHADATAHFLGSVLRFWSLTAPIFKLGIAVVHTDIYGRTHIEKARTVNGDKQMDEISRTQCCQDNLYQVRILSGLFWQRTTGSENLKPFR